MIWTAIVPLKKPRQRKTRLSQVLAPTQRDALSVDMFRHVVSVLRDVPELADIAVVCEETPERWHGRVIGDSGAGLNGALSNACRELGGENLLIIHADLPLLSRLDVEMLLDAARDGGAIAPDRHERGTNALALRKSHDFAFAFGPDSFRAHRRKGGCAVVRRRGLAFDIDTPDDLALAKKAETGLAVPVG